MRTNKGAVIGLSVVIGVGGLAAMGNHHGRFSEGGPSYYSERLVDRMSGEHHYHHAVFPDIRAEVREELRDARRHANRMHRELREELGEIYGHRFERHGDTYTITLRDGHRAIIEKDDLYRELQPIMQQVDALPSVLGEQFRALPKKDGKSWDAWGKEMDAWGSSLEQRMDAWSHDMELRADELEKNLEKYEVAR